jgi:phage shock protein A
MAAKKPVHIPITAEQSDETRFAVLQQAMSQISQDVCDVDTKADETKTMLETLTSKVDKALEGKADKSEVTAINSTLAKMQWTVIALLVSMVGTLLTVLANIVLKAAKL